MLDLIPFRSPTMAPSLAADAAGARRGRALLRGAALLLALSAFAGLASCGGEDCWNYGHNCSSDYIKASGDDRGCCSGKCETSALSGVLVCR